jgi:5-methylthioadenosine/S-adenosylhomocysteine deaminase
VISLRTSVPILSAFLFAAACGPPASNTVPPHDGGSDGGADGGDGGPDGGGDGGPFCAPDPLPAPLGDATVAPGASTVLLLRGRVVTPELVLEPGEVLISGTTIGCVAPSCATSTGASAATVIDTRGVIFPGLVDAHNHTQYDYLPPWTPSPPRLFQDRYQWPQLADYKAWVASVNANETAAVCEQVKYGEVRAMLGGATTIQGTSNIDRRCFRTLVHNAEYSELSTGTRTNIPGIGTVDDTAAQSLRAGMQNGTVTAYVIHLAEGTDASSLAEFTSLVAKGLLLPPTVLIHGTALGATQFAQMAQARAKLIWSPQSNLVLYGQTTDVPAALAAGVHVSLAPDWTLSGGPTMLHELKTARRHSCDHWGGLLDARALVQMVTTRPAEALAIQGKVGRLAHGFFGDVLVIRDRGLDAYRTLIEAQLADVRLVVIGGNVRYGDDALIAALGRSPCESIEMCGEAKRVCVPDTTDPTDHLDEGLAQILGVLKGFYPSPMPLDGCP